MSDVKAPPTSRAAVGMGAIALVSRATGFLRVLIVAAVLGTSYLGNAFQAADLLTNVLFDLLAAGALSAVLVPAFVRLLDAGDQAGAEEVAGGVLWVALAGLGVLTILGELTVPLLARALTLGVPASVAADERELVAFLLRFVLPQVMLYAAGAVAIAVLHARRRFQITVAAPMGSTVVMVVCLLLFSASVTGVPGFDLTTTERLLLAAASTGGVIGFVGILVVAVEADGFRLRPRRPRGDARVREVLRHSGWGIVLHSAAGMIMGASLVLGSRAAGAVVAYQVGFAFFLAPYAILSQPIHTAVLPELVLESHDADLARFRSTVRWAIERMALFVLPVTAALAALALPGMRLVSFGEVSGHGPGLLAASVASLAIGLLPYGVFLLLARAYYALGDSRTPGLVSLGVGVVGVVSMAIGTSVTHGAALAGAIGGAHSLAYTVGCIVLLRGVGRRTGERVAPRGVVRMVGVSAAVGLGAWAASRPFLHDDPSRVKDLALLGVVGVVGAGLVLVGYRVLGLPGALTTRVPLDEPMVPDGLEPGLELPL